MAIILLLIDLFLKTPSPKTYLSVRLLGYGLLLIAFGFGLYFLFQALIPVIGYLESGATISLILSILGSFSLFLSRERKKVNVLDQIGEKAKEIYNNTGIDLEKFTKEHAGSIIIASSLAGLVLYQIVNLMKNKSSND